MSSKTENLILTGLPTARGYAVGPVFIYRGEGEIPIPHYVVEEGSELAELARLRQALAETRKELEEMIKVLRERTGRDDVRVFECHLMILEDEILTREIESYVTTLRLNAEAAVRRTMDGARAQFERMSDAYFRERAHDVNDIEHRLLKRLTGHKNCEAHLKLTEPSIIVADDLTPSETVQLPREYVLGFATNGGSTTSHVALLARALGIPAVSGLGNVTKQVTPGQTFLLDGTKGLACINPSESLIEEYVALIRKEKEFTKFLRTSVPAGTLKDGSQVRICTNLHPGVPMEASKLLGARGVGLYRTEYLWLERTDDPTEEEQFEVYKAAVEASNTLCEDSILTIRLLDLGGDKLMRGQENREANPFLGNRSIRYLLSHRAVLHTQLRAILRASAFGRLAIMSPMVSCVEEIRMTNEEYQSVCAELDAEGIAYNKHIPLGVMIEVPSAAINADLLAPHVSFFSIGTNDLVQYTLAADRGNDAVAYLYQPLNPAVMRLVKHTVVSAKANNVHVAVCGESASDPVIGPYWVALGVDTLSMSASFIPPVAQILANLTRADLDEYAQVPQTLPSDATGAEIYAACRAWLKAKLPELSEII